MRFLRENKINKTILVISDTHLAAGSVVDGRINLLEDFQHDRELVEFLDHYSSGQYQSRPVELVINGDFFDFLAVPFVPYFDDEFWSERAALDKLKIIMEAHPQVMEAMQRFLSRKNKKIIYIIGNHDGELVFDRVREYYLQSLPEEIRGNFIFYLKGEYIPVEGVVIKHGHEYELAHDFDVKESIVESSDGEKYFLPPWGSYYVIRVMNKFKEERAYVNQVHPIRTFLIYGLIFDTLFTLRFVFSTCYYFIMVRFLYFYQNHGSLKQIIRDMSRELDLFKDSETITEQFFTEHKVKALILGHTHRPIFRSYEGERILVNTGTWIKMLDLDFSVNRPGINLTYCQIEVSDKKKDAECESFEHLDISLNSWKGSRELPYVSFS